MLAILQREPERGHFNDVIANADRCVVSVVAVYETSIVLYFRRGAAGVEMLLEYLEAMDAHVAAFERPLAEAALAAYISYGKGIHPSAKLNLCDCVSYALSKSLNAPLLFKGDDFSHTDVLAA